MKKIKVVFRVFRGGEVIALFPQLLGDRNHWTCESYMHHGQHGSADVALTHVTKLATPEQCAPLERELESIGYVLDVRKRITRHDEAIRRAALK
jgi:predicted NAD/FAD-binding protein